MATKLKDLKLDDAHATAILEKAIEYESFTEELPSSKRERIKAAGEQITLMIDAWIDDEVTPDNPDADVAAMGVAIEEIFALAGVEIDEDGDVSFGEMGELEEGEGDEDEEEDGDEVAIDFDIEAYIEGYPDLSPASKVKAIKALELDPDDDDDYNTLVGIYEWEESQATVSSRVTNYLDDIIPPADAADEEDEPEEEEEEEDEGAEEAGGEGEWEEPWDKYDKQTAQDVKKHLDKLLAKDELTVEMAQYVIDYETAREKPPTRKRIIDHTTKLMEELEGGGEAEEEPEEEAPRRSKRPARSTTTRATGSRRRSRAAEPEEEPEPVSPNGIYVISGGEFEDITAFGVFAAAGAVADMLADGVEEVTVAAG